jgi:hypothetical protein
MSERDPETIDTLELAEAVAAGRLGLAQAEALVRAADGPREEARIAELRALSRAATAVLRHGDAYAAGWAAANRPGAEVAALGMGAQASGADSAAGGHEHRASSDPDVPDTRRLSPGRIRPRRGPGATVPRWSGIAAVVAVAVIVAGLVLARGLGSGTDVGGRPDAPASGQPGPAATEPASGPPGASSSPVAATSLPAVVPPGEALPGAPGVAFWAPDGADRVALYAWHPGGTAAGTLASLAVLDAWPDHSNLAVPNGLGSVQRVLVASPDGSRVAFLESTGSGIIRARLRVFSTAGTLLWTSPESATPAASAADPVSAWYADGLAWSADGSILAAGTDPWTLIRFDGTGDAVASTLDGMRSNDTGYRLLGFSADGTHLYGYETQGEAEWWQRPVRVDASSGALETLTVFGGGADGLAVSNATFPGDLVNPGDGRALAQPLVAKGDASWGTVGSAGTTLLGLPPAAPSGATPRWGTGDTIVVAGLPDPGASPATGSVQRFSIDGTGRVGDPAWVLSTGTKATSLVGVRGGFALVLESGVTDGRALDALGFDEAVLVRLDDMVSVAIRGPGASSDGLGFHFAGWLP